MEWAISATLQYSRAFRPDRLLIKPTVNPIAFWGITFSYIYQYINSFIIDKLWIITYLHNYFNLYLL